MAFNTQYDSKFKDELEKDFTCLVCFNWFSASAPPRMLHCGHNFCLNCLRHMIEDATRVMACPLCNIFSKEYEIRGIVEGTLPINLSLKNRSIEVYEQITEDICGTHNGALKVWECGTCE